jgi:hypothetical protein
MDPKPTFQRATKTQAKLRMALDGPAGSGKTFTGLIAATALRNGGKIAVIDTEHGSASKYADMFEFDVLELHNFHPQHYIDGIRAAEEAGYSVILLDSLSHAWEGEGGVLQLHEEATKRQRTENSYTAWRDVTPIHRDLVEAILQSKCHIIATMRSKMDYVQTKGDDGRTTIKKVGMAPVQRAGMEYEFDIVADLDVDHNMVISKTRCFAIADQVVSKPTAAWFGTIKVWLGEGAPAPAVETPKATPALAPSQPAPKGNGGAIHWSQNAQTRKAFWAECGRRGLTNDQVHTVLGHDHLAQYTGTYAEALALIDAWIDARTADAQVDALNVPQPIESPF